MPWSRGEERIGARKREVRSTPPPFLAAARREGGARRLRRAAARPGSVATATATAWPTEDAGVLVVRPRARPVAATSSTVHTRHTPATHGRPQATACAPWRPIKRSESAGRACALPAQLDRASLFARAPSKASCKRYSN